MTKKTALLFNLSSIICWSISPVMIRYVREYFSVSFQNFYRFGVSIFILWIFTFVRHRRKGIFGAIRNVRYPVPKLLLIALCNFGHQFFLIKGVYVLLPGFVTIVEESTIIFAVLLAFIFLPEERLLIKRIKFLAGLLAAVAGVLITALPELTVTAVMGESSSVSGVLFILVSSFSWAAFSLLVKLWLPEVPAAVSSSLVFTLVIPYFFIGLIAGGGQGVLQAETPVSAWMILSLSGVIGIGLGYSFYYQSLKGLGVTLTSSLGLLIPVFTAVISFFVYGETLSPIQLAGSAVLLSGCLVVVRTK